MGIRGIYLSVSISNQNGGREVTAKSPNTNRSPSPELASNPSSYSNDVGCPGPRLCSPMNMPCTGRTRHKHECSRPCSWCRHTPGRWRHRRCSRSHRAASSLSSSPGRGKWCCSEPGSQSCKSAVLSPPHRLWLLQRQPPCWRSSR